MQQQPAQTASAAMAAADGKSPARQALPLPAVSTAGRLKYADPRSLPSFPSSGLAPDGAAASAAATLGWSKQKTVDIWTPDKTSSASAAAVLATDYKMTPLWEPAANPDGYKAALLAAGSAGAAMKQASAKSSSSRAQETWGNSAAKQAFHANRPASAEPAGPSHGASAATQAFNMRRSLSVKKINRPATPPGDKSLIAAKGAMSLAQSSIGVKDAHAAEVNAATSALDGATKAHRASMQAKPPLQDAGAVSVTTMTRNMFTANPPVKPELDERTDNERLHQSALDMAKKMYQQQQKMVDQAKKAQVEQSQAAAEPSPYLNLQDAAYKQAQERLAKLHDEHLQSREYQEYYGNDKGPRHRFSVAAKLRRWSFESGDELDDRQRSQKIRQEMSMFSTKLSQVDQDKREKDREALLAAAQRNVKARLQGMDEKVYQETGRATPAMLSEWQVKAQQAAQSRHDSRTENKDKVDIGGGKFMTSEEVDAIASKRMQPVLDDINEKARAERERQAVLKMEEEARREEAEKQKAREREMKEINKKTKEQEKQEEKARKMQEKQEEKARKEDEKAVKAEEKRQAKEGKRKSKLEIVAVGPGHVQERTSPGNEGAARDEDAQDGSSSAMRSTAETRIEPPSPSQRKAESTGSTSPTSKVKGWIRSRFSRGKSMSENGEKRRSFFGGAAMAKEVGPNRSTASLGNRSTSMRDVAIAGKSGDNGAGHGETVLAADNGGHEASGEREAERDSRGVSPVSTCLEDERQLDDGSEKGDDDQEAQKMSMEPPRPIEDPSVRASSSPTRDSRFLEMMDR